MKKIILDLAVTLDGFIEGPHGEIDWCVMGDDMDFEGFLSGIDTIFYGRVSYDAWGNFQPPPDASPAEKRIWEAVHSKTKVVFTRQHLEDNRATFIRGDLSGAVADIKTQGGKDIWLYGGAILAKTFIHLGLIDQYRISIHPIALGRGKPLFEDLKERVILRLMKTNVFKSGVVQLIYEPVK